MSFNPFLASLLFLSNSYSAFGQNDYQAIIDAYTKKVDSIMVLKFAVSIPADSDTTLRITYCFFEDTATFTLIKLDEFDLADHNRVNHYYYCNGELVKVDVILLDGHENPKCAYYYKDKKYLFRTGFGLDEIEFDAKYYLQMGDE